MDPDRTTERELARIAESFGVDVVYVFGSRAVEIAAAVAGNAAPGDAAAGGVGTERPDSDVDIGVQPSRGRRLTAQDRVRMTIRLEDLLGVGRVDLVILPEANPFLAADIVRGELLYARDLDEEAALQLYHLRRAGDLAPFVHERWRETVGSGS